MEHKGTVTITTEHLALRRFTMTDLNEIFDNCWSDFEVWKWTRYAPMNSLTDVMNNADMFTEKWFAAYERPTRYSWAIVLFETNEVIGRIFAINIDNGARSVELTYEIGRNWWNKGLMSEAVKAVIDFFFDEVGMNRIYAYHADANPASGRVMQKCGMLYEGTARQACYCNNGIFDMVNYAILYEDRVPSRE